MRGAPCRERPRRARGTRRNRPGSRPGSNEVIGEDSTSPEARPPDGPYPTSPFAWTGLRMKGSDLGPQFGADSSRRPASSTSHAVPTWSSTDRPRPVRKVWLWSAVVLATVLTLTATLTLVPLSRATIVSRDVAFLALAPAANGTIPGQAALLLPAGQFCGVPPRNSLGVTGTTTFSLAWATNNGTTLPDFNLYVPSYMGIDPGTYVYSVANASRGNFTQQVEGAGALCQWALDFGATFTQKDSVVLEISTSTTYSEMVPLL